MMGGAREKAAEAEAENGNSLSLSEEAREGKEVSAPGILEEGRGPVIWKPYFRGGGACHCTGTYRYMITHLARPGTGCGYAERWARVCNYTSPHSIRTAPLISHFPSPSA